MHFYKRLYIGSSIMRKKRQIIWKLKRGKTMPTIYCITLAYNHNQDMLDIYHNGLFKQPYFQQNPPYVIGIAGGYHEAVELVETMLKDTMSLTGTYDVRKLCLTMKPN